MASRALLGRILSIGRLPGGRGRLQMLGGGREGLRRPVGSAAHGGIKADAGIKEQEPHLDRFSDPRVAHQDRQFIQFLDRMLDAIKNPQSLAHIQRRRLANGLKILDDDI